MNIEEHLELILTFCRSRLALAEKRTPGTWEGLAPGGSNDGMRLFRGSRYLGFLGNSDSEPAEAIANAAFIAACAGAAEAGWRATIAAIEGLQQLAQTTVTWMAIHQHTLRAILAAYPLELLQPTT